MTTAVQRVDETDRFADLASIELRVDRYWLPDSWYPQDYPGPELVCVVFAGKIATLTGSGKTVSTVGPSLSRALLDAWTAARTEAHSVGVDTALSRVMTDLHVQVRHPEGPSSSFALSTSINHHEPHALPPQWSTALRLMRDSVGPVDGPTADAWDHAMAWAGPVPLGPIWESSGAVRVPHVVTAIAHDGPLYIRSGQPPDHSSLYELRDGRLRCVDDDTLVDGKPHVASWTLPCGAGTVAIHREWDAVPRIVIRANAADRWLYVQKG